MMFFEEHTAKTVVLAPAGISVPRGIVCGTVAEVVAAVAQLGPSVVKAQIPGGKRGKAGGIKPASTPEDAAAVAREIIGMTIDGIRVERVLVEERCLIDRELYAAVLIDQRSRSPIMLFSTAGGIDVEEAALHGPDTVRRLVIDTRRGFGMAEAGSIVQGLDLGRAGDAVSTVLAKLYRIFSTTDAELIELNPLAILRGGEIVALDCKFLLDEAAASRQVDLVKSSPRPQRTALEQRAQAAGLRLLELDGDVGVLANGAGLTMTTMDVIQHFGGRPANFLEIGGEAYVQAEAAFELVLSNPRVRSVVINLCGAFARTDVMVAGIVTAWQSLKPAVPIFFSIHGTGEQEAITLVRERLGIEPYDLMEDAVRAAVEAAR